MRRFGPNDALEPVLAPMPAPDDMPVSRQGLIVLLLGIVLAVASCLVFFLMDQSKLVGIQLAAGAVLTMAGGLQLIRAAKEKRPQSRRMSWKMTVPIVVLIGAGALEYWNAGETVAAVVLGAFAALVAVYSILLLLRAIQDRRVAQAMRARTSTTAVSSAQDAPDPNRERLALPMTFDVYLQQELPILSSYRQQVTADCNIVGRPPARILYLYNFFSGDSLVSKIQGGWRRFGPVFFLGSPQDISYQHTFDLKIDETVSHLLLASNEAVDEHLEAAAREPLRAPGDKQLAGFAYFSGGYPQHFFLCTDATWQHAVTRLFYSVDVVIIDATGYRPERAGLNWEIGRVVDHVPAHRFVVIVDGETDQISLSEHFRQAWAAMRSDSPNNRQDAGPVRFVVLDLEKRRLDDVPGAKPDAAAVAALTANLNPVARTLRAAQYSHVPATDQIYGLFM
jgi:hypothetical protein